MAIYEVQAPDGRILEIEGPDGADEAQVLAEAQRLYQQPQAPATEPGILQRVANAVTGADRMTPEVDALPDIGGLPELSDLSFAGAKTGLGTLFAGPEETVKVIQANFPGVQVRQDQAGNYLVRSSLDGQEYAIKPGFRASDIPKLIAGAAAFTPAGRATSILGGIGAGAATQGAIEATQAATGGTVSPADIGIAGAVGAIPGLATAARRGVQAITGGTPQNPLVASAARENIPLMTSDVLPPESFITRTAQATGERVPIAGTGPTRVAQQAARVQAVANIADEFSVPLTTSLDEKIAAELAAKRSADLTKYSTLKRETLQELDQFGAVPVNRSVTKLNQEVARLRALGATRELEPALTRLEGIRDAMQGKSATQLDEVRKLLGGLITDPELTAARKAIEKVPSLVYGELRKDISDFALQRGGKRAATKLTVANARLRDMVGELDNSRLKSALDEASDTPEKTAALLFSANKSDVQRLYRNLTPQGRATARVAVLQRTIKDALPNGLADITQVSPQRFANNIAKRGNQIGVFFGPQDRTRLEGLAKVLQATQRASVASATPPTGVQAMPFFAGTVLADIFGSAGAATVGAGSIGVAARAYESKPVRDVLLRLGNTNPKSPQFDALVRQFTTAIQAQE